jgi:hypothetical protein
MSLCVKREWVLNCKGSNRLIASSQSCRAPIKFAQSARLYAWNNLRTNRGIFMKFNVQEFCETLSCGIDFCLDQTTTTDTSHEDPHAFPCASRVSLAKCLPKPVRTYGKNILNIKCVSFFSTAFISIIFCSDKHSATYARGARRNPLHLKCPVLSDFNQTQLPFTLLEKIQLWRIILHAPQTPQCPFTTMWWMNHRYRERGSQ